MENLFVCDKEVIKRIIFTLNNITVSGRDNMDKMLGVIMTLETALNPPAAEETTTEASLESEENTDGR